MKTKFSFDDFLRSMTTPHPARDWLILLTLETVLFACLAAYAAYLFMDIRWGNAAVQDGSASPAPQIVTKAQLESEIQKYQARQSAFEARDFGLPKLSDPAQ